MAAGEQPAVAGRRPGQQPQSKRTRLATIQDLGEGRLDVVIANDEVVTRPRIERDASVPEMRMDNTRLVLLVIVHPQLHRRLLHHRHRTGGLTGT